MVNAIAVEVIDELLQSDFSKPITVSLVNQAIQNIIIRRDTHIDSLLDKLNDERVRKVIEPMLLGEGSEIDKLSDDYNYVKDLGLIRDTKYKIEPANPIYAEVIIRTLSYNAQDSLQKSENPYKMPRYLKDGRINVNFLLTDFQEFWRENGAVWQERYDYKEAAAHIVLMAFLQRVINGGGQIVREMALETKRLDLCIIYQGLKYPIELKLYKAGKALSEGLAQTAGYMDSLGCKEGWLMFFDARPNISWEEKLYMKTEQWDDKTITVVGC